MQMLIECPKCGKKIDTYDGDCAFLNMKNNYNDLLDVVCEHCDYTFLFRLIGINENDDEQFFREKVKNEENKMTLKEAIEHAKDKAKELGNCECAKEHMQLAKWLEELALFRETIDEICNTCDYCNCEFCNIPNYYYKNKEG